MGIVYSYLFKCKCGYEIEFKEGSYLCADENGKSVECSSSIYHCKKCGSIQEFFEDGNIKCASCGGKMKPIVPIISMLFPKILDYLPAFKCPKCGKKHLKLSREIELDEVQKQFLEEISNPIYQATKYVDVFFDSEIEQIKERVKKALLFILILCLLIIIYIFRDFILANLMAYTLTH